MREFRSRLRAVMLVTALLFGARCAVGQEPRAFTVGREGLTLADKLGASSPKIRVRVTQERFVETPAQLFLAKLVADKKYRITLESTDFDVALAVQTPEGVQVAWDDDSGGGGNSALTVNVLADGVYRIFATAAKGFGAFRLEVKEAGEIEVHEVGARLLRKGRIDSNVAAHYCVRLPAGKAYLMEMVSADAKALDPYLRVLEPSGRELAVDDDSGGDVHARIVFRPESSGTYQIVATSFAGGRGDFTLTVRPYGLKEAKANAPAHMQGLFRRFQERLSSKKYAHATSLLEIQLPWLEAIERPDGAHIAEALETLSFTYSQTGRYVNAEWAARQAVSVREERIGKNHPDLAQSLDSLAGVLLATGRYAEAEREYARGLALRESKLGANHPSVTTSLEGLGSCYSAMGRIPKAEPIFRRSLQIAEANHGRESEQVASALDSLGSILADQMGRYADAEPHLLRSLQVRRKVHAENTVHVAASMTNLARLYRYMEQYAKAEPLALRAAQIDEAVLGKDHMYLGGDLLNLALLYAEMGQPAKAEPLFQRSISIFERFFGPNNHSLGVILTMPANFYRETGQFDKAEALYRRGLSIGEATLGKEHPTVTDTLHNLAWNYAGQKQWSKAIDHAQDARVRTAQYLTEVLPALSEPEQLALLEVKLRKSLDLALSLGRNGPQEAIPPSAEWLLNAKAIAHQALAEQQLLLRDSKDPSAKHLIENLKETRARLAAHIHRTPQPGEELAYQQTLRNLKAAEQEQAQSLARSVGRGHRADTWVTLKELRRKLDEQAVFIDIARFPVYDFDTGRWGKARYVAWVTPPAGAGDVERIDLGDADTLDELVQRARASLFESAKNVTKIGEEEAFKEVIKHLHALAERALHPLLPAIGKHREWIVAPDGALWLTPWNALPLPQGAFAIEKHLIRHVVSGRDLVQSGEKAQGRSAHVFADPDYDLTPGKTAAPTELRGIASSVAGRRLPGQIGAWNVSFEFLDKEAVIYDEDDGGVIAGKGTWKQEGDSLTIQTGLSLFKGALAGKVIQGERSKRDASGKPVTDAFRIALTEGDMRSVVAAGRVPKVARLPGTALEADLVAPRIHKWLSEAPKVHLEDKASEAVLKQVRGPRALMLATHGYFMPAQVASSKDRTEADPKKRPMMARDQKGEAIENPLLRCGLLLAGCNKRSEAKLGEDDGILTGLEIVGLDLRGCELVVLSACETGLGDVRSGEGVAGLRQAFQLAGAKGVLASLWQVPDRETALLMNAFYSELTKGKSQAAALREAQLARIAARRTSFGAAHPFFWAAFTLTSRGDE